MKKGLLSLVLLTSLVALPSCMKKDKKKNGKKMHKRGEKKARKMKNNNKKTRRYSEAEGKKPKEAVVA